MKTTPREIARAHGYAEATVYRWVRTGELPCERPHGIGHGRPIVIDADAAEAFIAARMAEAV